MVAGGETLVAGDHGVQFWPNPGSHSSLDRENARGAARQTLGRAPSVEKARQNRWCAYRNCGTVFVLRHNVHLEMVNDHGTSSRAFSSV